MDVFQFLDLIDYDRARSVPFISYNLPLALAYFPGKHQLLPLIFIGHLQARLSGALSSWLSPALQIVAS